MKKVNFKLFTALLAVLLVAGGIVFYACNKDDNNAKKETAFVAKNYGGACVQVTIFRDKNNNAQFVIKNVPTDTDAVQAFRVSATLNIEPLKTKDDGALVYEIPNDAIYWLVPLDDNEPVKFEPVNGAKTQGGGSSSVMLTCNCWEWPSDASNKDTKCESKKQPDGSEKCVPATGSRCSWCPTFINANKGSTETILAGSAYLIQSNTVTINGITYE
jgi:hypothetical protein